MVKLSSIKPNPENPRLIKSCVICRCEFKTKPSHFDRRKTCSMKCRGELLKIEQSKTNHPLYSNGKSLNQLFECKTCNKMFCSNKGYESRTPLYCSKECYSKSLYIERYFKTCNWCKNTFRVKYLQGDHKFCSVQCTAHFNGSKTKWIKRPEKAGENSHWWKGGVTSKNEALRRSLEYKQWRIFVFERDKYTCQVCKIKGGKIHADHIKPFAFFPELRFDINNGRTLCIDCHKKTDTYGKNAFKYENQTV